MSWFPLRSRPRRGPGRFRTAHVLGSAVLAAVLALAGGCTGEPSENPRGLDPSGEYFSVKQGTQLAYSDLRIGLGSTSSNGVATMQLYADDAPVAEVMRAREGDRFDVGHRTITVERVGPRQDTVTLSILEAERSDSPVPEPSLQSTEGSADPGEAHTGGPMADPDTVAVRVGHQITEAGLTIGLGSTAGGTARMLVTGGRMDDHEVTGQAGARIEVGEHTLTIVEVADGVAYLKVDG